MLEMAPPHATSLTAGPEGLSNISAREDLNSLNSQEDTQQNLSVGPVVPSVPDDQKIEPVRSEKVQFRVLIIGKANAGKTSILQRVCDTTDSPEIYTLDSSGNRKQVCSRPY